MSINAPHSYMKTHPIRVGMFVVLGVLALGASLSFASGYATPQPVNAQMVGSITVTAAPTISSSVSSVAATVAATVSSVVSTTVSTVNVVAQQAQNQNSGTNSTPSVTPPADSTEVSQIEVTSQNNNDNPSTEPCCTEQPTTVEPAVVIAEVPVEDNPFTLPCCTVNTTSVTTPQTPVVVPPTTPVPADLCLNIGGIQTTVPAGMVADSDGNCVPPSSLPPVCTLSASASSVLPGSSVTLTWTTNRAVSGSINNGVGNATPIATGSRATVVNGDTTYTLSVLGNNGQTVTCSAPVTVTTTTSSPACTLSASASSVAPGSSVTLSWTSRNLTSASIDQGVGAVTPLANGSRAATVNGNTTYTLTGVGTNGQTVTCSAPVTVTTPSPACTLSASASNVSRGASVDLTWTTTNAISGSIDHGVGAATPISGGTKSVVVDADTTYTLSVLTNTGSTITCAAPVKITTGGGGGGPKCELSASPTTVANGNSTTITWGGTDISTVFIDDSAIGTTTSPSGSKSVTVNGVGTHTYTGTFKATNGSTLTCTASVVVESGGGGCTSNCGGGGGGNNPRVVLSSLRTPGDQPLSFVYLSQIPYTGLELGPWGTALYWIMLMLWSLAAAYLVFFTAMPFAFARVSTFGGKVKEALNNPAMLATHAPAHTAHDPHGHAASAAHGHASTGHGHDAHAPAPERTPTLAQDGFRAFSSGGALSIDDIVKGLAREAEARPDASAHDITPDFAHAPVAARVAEEVVVPAQAVAPAHVPAPMAAAPVSHDVREFLSALIAGNREAVFGTVRSITREGGDSEEFLTHAVCALDDAYRSRVDGSVCHPDIASLTANCHPSFLERLVTSLTTAVDGSYSTGVTGVKLALTRALAVVNG